jgi:lipopolysaccharide/colanic/teichoic acid biosynthesis glycosyltransferase
MTDVHHAFTAAAPALPTRVTGSLHALTGSSPSVHDPEHHEAVAAVIPLLPDAATVESRADSRYNRLVKPALDRLGAAVLILLLLPVLILGALVVLLTLGRPILYRQRRVGQHGAVFEMIKFRTMEPDRRQQRRPVPAHADRRRRHKSDHDPRHTRVGRLLRRTSLDELPQLWNVARGDMSLIGPRPELEDVVAGYAAWQHQRHQVKPGITGLWQVTDRQRSAGDMHLHTATDLIYLTRLSLRTDLSILLRTPTALVKGR